MDFFSNTRFRFPNKEVRDVSACAIQADTRNMLKQMCLPLIAERRVKGALSTVSRETGLPFSKLRRLYYGITDHILAFELKAIEIAYDRWLLNQEKRAERQLDQLRAMRTARLNGRLALNDSAQNRPCSMAAAVDVGTDTD